MMTAYVVDIFDVFVFFLTRFLVAMAVVTLYLLLLIALRHVLL